MAAIGQLNSPRAAQAFVDYLIQCGIDSHTSINADYTLIHVVHDNDIDRARHELQLFLENPNDPKYQAASWSSGTTHASPYSQQTSGKGLTEFFARAGVATKSISAIAITVTLLTWFGTNNLTHWFAFKPDLILDGQIHRIITPIFLHFPILGILVMHLLFNLMWFWDLGGQLEKRLGAFALIYQTFVIGVVSNTAQHFFTDPRGLFGGLSGVVFGLLGYIWVRGEIDPKLGFRLNKSIVIFMLIWMAMGFAGMIGSVANAAHFMGLVTGVMLAWLDVKVFKVNGKIKS